MEPRLGEPHIVLVPPSGDKPRVPTASRPAGREAATERVPDSLRILIVEDELLLGRAAARVLARDGHDAIAVQSAEEALLVLRERGAPEAFDVVFSDVGLPGMSGWQLASVMRTTYPGVAVVMTSGWASSLPDDAVTRLGMAPEDFVCKPYSSDDLRRALASATSRRSHAGAAR